jgi:hypothetical protein
MTMDKITATDKVEAVTKYNTMPEDTMGIGGHYTAICYSALMALLSGQMRLKTSLLL